MEALRAAKVLIRVVGGALALLARGAELRGVWWALAWADGAVRLGGVRTGERRQ